MVAPRAFTLYAALASCVSATTYYADCSSPCPGKGTSSDPYCSLSEVNSPTFKAGDVIAFKAGTACMGTLSPRGSGSSSASITITQYGSSSHLPVINGTGAGAAVSLKNQDYWIIANLSVTNPAPSLTRRQGIVVDATDGKTHRGIVIEENEVTMVAGQTNKATNTDDFVYSAGIMVNATNSGSRYDNILVQGNTVSDCGGGGIKVRTGDMSNQGKKIHVTRNEIQQCGGDGIIISYAYAPLIDYNIARDLGKGAYPFSGGNFAGMWVLGDHNPTISHNVVYGNSKSVADSQAFDCDWGNTGNCTVEYNFSRDNYGGAFLSCDGCGTSGGADQVVRYNIFQNDCRINTNGNKPTLYFYNNVMYCPDKNFDLVLPTHTAFTNNIFVGDGDSTLPSGNGDISWDWNVFQDVKNPGQNGISGDPRFVNPGKGGDTLSSAAGYKLTSSSPALSNGAIIAQNGGLDFFGNAVSSSQKPNRGAYNGAGVGE